MKGFRRACEWYCASKLCSRGRHWTRWPLILVRKMLLRPLKCRQEAKPCKARGTSFMPQGEQRSKLHIKVTGRDWAPQQRRSTLSLPPWAPQSLAPHCRRPGAGTELWQRHRLPCNNARAFLIWTAQQRVLKLQTSVPARHAVNLHNIPDIVSAGCPGHSVKIRPPFALQEPFARSVMEPGLRCEEVAGEDKRHPAIPASYMRMPPQGG